MPQADRFTNNKGQHHKMTRTIDNRHHDRSRGMRPIRTMKPHKENQKGIYSKHNTTLILYSLSSSVPIRSDLSDPKLSRFRNTHPLAHRIQIMLPPGTFQRSMEKALFESISDRMRCSVCFRLAGCLSAAPCSQHTLDPGKSQPAEPERPFGQCVLLTIPSGHPGDRQPRSIDQAVGFEKQEMSQDAVRS